MTNKSKAKARKDYAVCHIAANLFKKIGEPSYRDKNAIHAALRHAYEHGEHNTKRTEGTTEKAPVQPSVIWVGHNPNPLVFSG